MALFVMACLKEIEALPEEVREDVMHAVSVLDAGYALSMPLSRPMPAVGHAVHELRISSVSGAYRVLYAFKSGVVVVIHAFKKTPRATPWRNIKVARKRLREVES